MEKNADSGVLMSVDHWFEQLKSVPSLTTSNSEELKSHLLDTMDDLKRGGLDEEEAFWIASRRLGDIVSLADEFGEVNMPVIQMRKIILVLTGIIVFFIFNSLMHLTTRLLFLGQFHAGTNPAEIVRNVLLYLTGYHFIFIISAILLWFLGKSIVAGIERLKLKPRHTFLLLALVISIFAGDLWLQHIIKENYNSDIITLSHYLATFDYSGYTFPLIVIICFVVLYRKYYSIAEIDPPPLGFILGNHPVKEEEMNGPGSILHDDDRLRIQFGNQLDDLINLKRQGLGLPQTEGNRPVIRPESAMSNFLIVLSGVLVFFFVYYLLHSSGRILLTVLQHFENDPALNIQRIWTFAIAFHLIFLVLATSVYLLDMNILQWVKRINIKPVHTIWLLFATIILALIDRYFFPISRNAIGRDILLSDAFENIFTISNYSLPLVIGSCFMILFYKYYRDNIRIR
jgi:hypothetical protein